MILNMDEFRVIDLKPSLAATTDPFFCSTTRGSGLKGVLSLFFFGCLTSTVSPGLISLGFVPSLQSAYALIFDFCSASLSVIAFRVSCRVFCLADAGDTSIWQGGLEFPSVQCFIRGYIVGCERCHTILSEKFVQFLFPIFALNDSSSHTLLKIWHEAFCLAISSWPKRLNFPVMES